MTHDSAGVGPITAEQWRRLEQLLPAALEMPPAERRAFIDRACADDARLRAELETLLRAHERPGLLDGPLTQPATEWTSDGAAGTTIGHYEVGEPLGSGGMGIVHRARDLRLQRTVALKFLPPSLSANPEAKWRFLQEARAAAALEHANVCTVHEIGETGDGRLFIAMAFVDGESLRSRIQRGPLRVDEAVAIARQIAAGLQCAHRSGIVHRDIKPANVMLGRDGVVKLVDFGIAKLAGTAQTRSGALGTIAYMAPEQVRGEAVDERTDLWSLGVVLYEMLTGRRPFTGESDAATLHAIVATVPPRTGTLRAGVPAALERIVERALSKDPTHRFASAGDVLEALSGALTAAPVRGWRRPSRRALAVAAGVVALAAAGAVRGWQSLANRRALDALPRIERLAADGSYVEAYALAVRAEAALPGDTTLERLLQEVSDHISVVSTPPGARVWLRRVAGDGSLEADSVLLGVTPIRARRVARSDYHLRIEHAGHAPVERLASSALNRAEASLGVPADIAIDVTLRPASRVPVDMVFVAGSGYALVGREAPTGAAVRLADYFIDTHEVTNAQFREFIAAGGYGDRRYWRHAFVRDGRDVPWEEALDELVDRTGLPGPRGWSEQMYAPGTEDHPVTGVTWYEAAAYAAFRGKRLPSLLEWEKAARDGRYTHFEKFVMPWGLADPTRGIDGRANFASDGTEPVGAHPAGISPWGAYDMAGNVEEWVANPSSGRRFIAGGAWDDPMYVFADYLPVSPFHASPSLGFRCAMDVPDAEGDHGDMEIPPAAGTPAYRPVDEAAYRALLQHFAYDPTPLAADVVERAVTGDWTRETIRIDGPWPDATLLYAYLPRQGPRPLQTIVFVPGTNTFIEARLAEETERLMASHVRAGRAVMTVLFKGMRGRPWDAGRAAPLPSSVQFRQELVLHATELRRAVDYLVTRADIDSTRIAYVGFSRGAGTWLPFAAIESRFRSVVLIGGGIDERMLPTLPEANIINFAPHIAAPKLLLNGRYDEEHPWDRRGLPLWRLLSEPKRLELVEGGHLPPAEVRVPAINAWLDETLGTVR